MSVITTSENYIVIDGTSIPKSSFTASKIKDGIRINGTLTGMLTVSVSGTTVDGNEVLDIDELISLINQNSFKSGGGSGEGAVNSVNGKSGDITLTAADVGAGTSNLQLGSTSTTAMAGDRTFATTYQGNLADNSVQTSQLSTGASVDTVPLRKSEGRIEVGTATDGADAINKTQFDAGMQGIAGAYHTQPFDTITGTANADQIPSLPVSKITGLQDSIDSKQSLNEKAQANGYAPLDASGLVPLVHLNVSGLQFKGAWNPNTNTPTIVDGTGSVGDFYKASESGSFNSGNGSFTYAIGDWVIFAGGIWQRLGSADTVAMVNGKLGNVVITKSDVGLGNVDNVSAANLRDRSTHTGTQGISTITDLTDIINAINSTNDSQTTAIASKANITHTHSIDNITGLQLALNAKQNTLTLKTVGGTSILGSGNISFPVDSNAVISTVTSNGVKTNEYSNRFEYTCKIPFSITVTANNFNTVVTTYILPIGVTIDASDEHYISIKNNSRTTAVCVFDNASRVINIGFANVWSSSTNPAGTVYIKLVKYK